MNVRNSYLIEVCARFWGYGFDNLHIFNDMLTKSIDLRQVGTFRPPAADNYESQAISPSRVETRGIWVNAGNLSASNESQGEGCQDRGSPFMGWEENTYMYPNSCVLSNSAARSSGLSVWTTFLGSSQDESSVGAPTRPSLLENRGKLEKSGYGTVAF